MLVSINLATRPFVELRPLLAKLRLAMIALALLATGLIIGLRALKERADAATAQMDALKAQTADYQGRMLKNEARMKQPQNRAVLERARFLNELFEKKSFSWTAVMMDLERVLPAGVQVMSIDPSISKEGDVNIRLRVNGDREKAVQLVRNLEKSRRFLSPRLSNESLQASQAGSGGAYNRLPAGAQTADPAGVQFDILSGYNPISTEEAAALSADAKKSSDNTGEPARHKSAQKSSLGGTPAAPRRVSPGGRR
jgi:type IV pilus assembly protein PilN